MRELLIVALLAGLAILDLVRLRSRRAGPSTTGLLVAAVPRALLPVAGGVTIGAFQFKAALEAIAETGSGGAANIARSASVLQNAALAGVVAFIVVLALPLAWSWMRRAPVSGALPVQAHRGRFLIGAVAVVFGLGYALFAVRSADRLAIGVLAPLTRAAVLTGQSSLPPLPAGYASYTGMSGLATAEMLEALVPVTTTGGIALCVGLIGLSLVTGLLLSGAPDSRAGGLVTQMAALALVAGAGWYGVTLNAGAQWLRSVAGG